ncbi:carbohydrate sulfotransferase 14 [Rhipicephalus sanguineus]|uniref:carbohydrate sulfotransferase 14 n=1 Tax=Rhipicephalus sanguineus TaxID=34632 RepID=UPI001895AAC4|nr:carbohydrate sulfotransferase 14 [Rhipicephalus sanguineus]
MATPSPKSLVIALVVAAVVLAHLAIVGRHRIFSQLAQCDCRTSRLQESTKAETPSDEDDIAGRLRKIDTYCEKYAGELQALNSWDDSLSRSSAKCTRGPRALYLVDDRRFAFCAVPKAATSSIKALVLLAQNASAKLVDADGIYNVFLRKFRLLCPSEYVRHHIVANYTRVIIVRHPFERLVSAYVNKIRTSRPTLAAAKKLYKDGYRGSGPNGTYTFAEFVKIILNMSVDSWDSHWAPYTARCRPCIMRYDLIVKVETLHRDLDFLLPRIGLAGWSFPKKNAKTAANVTDGGSKHYFAELTRQQVLQLHAIYMYDFEFFGYTLKGYATPAF